MLGKCWEILRLFRKDIIIIILEIHKKSGFWGGPGAPKKAPQPHKKSPKPDSSNFKGQPQRGFPRFLHFGCLLLAAPGAHATCATVRDKPWTLSLSDDLGDGWNGAVATITDCWNDVSTYTLATGYPAPANAPNGDI